MIKIKINDTIVDIIEKIESQKSWDIILDFPLGHPILHNYISLKILKSKVWDRKLIIASNDRIGKRIGTRLWIEYSLIKNTSFIQKEVSENLMKHNFTFWEFFKFQVHSYLQELRNSLQNNKKINSLGRYSRIYQEKTSLHVFIMAFIWSLFLFLFIYYFAISKSYIYITPEIVVKKEAHNFIFKENIKNNILWSNKYIKINTLSQKVKLSENYSSTQIKNSRDISRWKVRLYNKYTEDQTLIPSTRLQSKDWIIFEIPDWVKIPAGVKDNFWKIAPGVVEVEVFAKLKDASWLYIWSRGNIKKNSPLILPALPEDMQDQIYAQSVEDFTWWIDDFQRIVSEEDIENARKLFEEKLKSEALKSIKNIISDNNKKNNTLVEILSWGKSIFYSNPKINLEDGVQAWSIRNSFSLSGEIMIRAYTYNKESIIQKLKTLIKEKKLEWVEKISHIDVSSLRMSEIIYTKENPFEMKATFEIEALFLHDFLHQDNNYSAYLSSKIRWLAKEDALKILLNDPKISNVEIEIRPFFSNKIPNIYQNIIFKIR